MEEVTIIVHFFSQLKGTEKESAEIFNKISKLMVPNYVRIFLLL